MKHIKSAIPFIIFTLLSFILYHKVLHTPFILDDNWYIADNYKIKNLSTFITDLSGTRYIGFLSFALNYYFNGLNTYGYHIVNILIHILNTFLLYLLVKITLNRLKDIDSRLKTQDTRLKFEVWSLESGVLGLYYLPFTVSLIFLVHPIQTQAVSYITQRFTSLATLFYLLAILLYIKARLKDMDSRPKTQDTRLQTKILSLKSSVFSLESWVLYLGSLVSTILAMKTKEISFTLPFIILLYEFTFLNNSLKPSALCPMPSASTPLPSAPRRLLYLLPFFLTLIIIPLSIFGSDLPMDKSSADARLRELQLMDIKDFSAYNYLLTQFRVIITYIRLIFLPINQHFEYDFPLSNSIFEPATLISFLVLLSIIIFAVYLFIRSRKTHHTHGLLVSFGMLWFFITLSVESSIIPIKDVIFEHRLYLPSVGFILSINTAIFYGLKTQDSRPKAKVFSLVSIVLSLFFIIIAIFSFSTYKRNVLWKDSLLFYLDEVKKSPNRPTPHNNLGTIYGSLKQLDMATKEFNIAIQLDPYNASPYYNMGTVYKNNGLVDKAIEHYQIGLKLEPNNVNGHYELGLAYYDKGLVDMAMEHYQIAIKLDPNYPEAYTNIGSIYFKKGLVDKAIEHYQIGLKLEPNNVDNYYNLGLAYYDKGLVDKAIEYYQIVLKLKPDFVMAYNNLGNAYYKKGLVDKAIEHYNIAIKLKPDSPNMYFNLGSIYYSEGLIDKAIEHYQIALRLKPDFSEAQDNLSKILKERNVPQPHSSPP